ncbi:MAG: HAD family hydrolase [Actinobacteria bacterium]|nr:MAG: HAD family hydrolase [Actinomycetota bacterium]
MRGVLLDALGTLLELRDPASALTAALREDHGLEITETQAWAALGAEMTYYRRHNHRASDPERLADLRRRCAVVLAEQLPAPAGEIPLAELEHTLLRSLRFAPYPDVRPALLGLRQAGLALVVVSNWDISLHDQLRETGIAELVDGAVSSAEVGADKSSPELFRAGLRLAGVGPQDAVHVGDSLADDVGGAHAAGLAAVLIDRLGTQALDADPQAPAPAAVIGSLGELPELIRAWEGTPPDPSPAGGPADPSPAGAGRPGAPGS